MRILLTNDDGIHAPGLKSLEKIARSISDDIWIVAPETDQSGAAHSLTLNEPLRLREVSARHFAVRGTPTDCVIMALRHIMPDGTQPDLVMSGVNRGQNIADDTTYSGTVAAAMEAALLGVRSVALSQAYGFGRDRATIRWQMAETVGPALVSKLLDVEFPKDTLLNINFPDCEPDDLAGISLTRQGRRNTDRLGIDERVDNRENPYFWISFQKSEEDLVEGTDIWALAKNRIAVTPVGIDYTHEDFHAALTGFDF